MMFTAHYWEESHTNSEGQIHTEHLSGQTQIMLFTFYNTWSICLILYKPSVNNVSLFVGFWTELHPP